MRVLRYLRNFSYASFYDMWFQLSIVESNEIRISVQMYYNQSKFIPNKVIHESTLLIC